MRIIDVIHQLLPAGTDAAYLVESPTKVVLNRPGGPRATFPNYSLCPVWPPDVFAVVGTIIDRCGCYTEASPNRYNLTGHCSYLAEITATAAAWDSMVTVPDEVQALWHKLVAQFGMVAISSVNKNSALVRTLLELFAIADEASAGMGWDNAASHKTLKAFAQYVLINATQPSMLGAFPPLPFWPGSLCAMVSHDHVIVLPKSITTTKGCTIRSLSHHLALLPCRTMLEPEWLVGSRVRQDKDHERLRLLLIPFPFSIPSDSFELAFPRSPMIGRASYPAYFRLLPKWLNDGHNELVSGKQLARLLVGPLIKKAKKEAGGKVPHGIVLPECALTTNVAEELVAALAGTGIEFLITGVLEKDSKTNRICNKAMTYILVSRRSALVGSQDKHHRWRIDRRQADSYGLNFDSDPTNEQWWEDIEVTHRRLPFYAMREDMSMVTLICEDLARMDPAMNAIRSVGPNLVVAILLDGPQVANRWPARYASVLADEPGCAVLTLTCAATVDLSNSRFVRDQGGITERAVGRWTEAANGGKAESINLAKGHQGILLTLQSRPKHQTTLDNRGDNELSRELSFVSQKSLMI